MVPSLIVRALFQASRLARLALIASQAGDGATATAATRMLGAALGPWLAASNTDALGYDATWGGIVSKDGVADYMADFGMGW
jgi:endo-1,3(4)-beta-glucanase